GEQLAGLVERCQRSGEIVRIDYVVGVLEKLAVALLRRDQLLFALLPVGYVAGGHDHAGYRRIAQLVVADDVENAPFTAAVPEAPLDAWRRAWLFQRALEIKPRRLHFFRVNPVEPGRPDQLARTVADHS